MKISLTERLEIWFGKRQNDWIHSGDLQRIVSQTTAYMPSNVSRRCREMVEDGKLEVKYEKGSALYRLKTRLATQPTPNYQLPKIPSHADIAKHPRCW